MLNQIPYQIKDNYKTIPFVEIIFPYIGRVSPDYGLDLSTLIKDKLERKLAEQLSFAAEVTLQAEFDKFVEEGNVYFDEFVEKMTLSLVTDYPVLDKILRTKTDNFFSHIRKIVSRFQGDIKDIKSTFNLHDIKIVDIDVSLGDGHNGEGTTLVRLSDGTKLIYKPRGITITNSYNSFIDWISFKLETDLKTFKVLDCGDYGWLEFVQYEEVNTEEDLQEYYYKAGMLLAITLLLGSKDCHPENVIASGKNPVMIDHETIIQPFFNDKSFRSWDDQFKIPPFSVLESVLIVNQDTGMPLDIAGYGVREHIEVTDLERKVINPNTINSKRTTRFITRKIVDKNIPMFNGKYAFANNYKEHLINGFCVAYDMFLNEKEELRSKSSPLFSFINNQVRYVWRPTFVYVKILNYMRAASFMASPEAYYSKLHELLSKAYKGKNLDNFKFILDIEVEQMFNGDIPIFNLNSNNDFLVENNTIKIFEYSCLENIDYRINLLSTAHKEEQLNYVNRWLTI